MQPAKGKVIVKVAEEKVESITAAIGLDSLMIGILVHSFSLNERRSLMLNTVRVELVKSQDSAFHTYAVKIGRGYNPSIAQQVATKIEF